MRIPHRLYGHVNVSERYSVGRFQEEAGAALEESAKRNRIAIVTGRNGPLFRRADDRACRRSGGSGGKSARA